MKQTEYLDLLCQVNTAIIKIRGAYAAWARKNGVNYHELLVLYSLRENQECTQKMICNNYLLPKQTVHNVIGTYRNRGWLNLLPGKGKEKILALTEPGKAHAASIMEPLERLEKEVIQQIGPEHLRRMIEMANAYGAVLEEMMLPEEQEGGNP